jgi:cell division inhibitor SepF
VGFVNKFKDFVGIPDEEGYDQAPEQEKVYEEPRSYTQDSDVRKNKVVDVNSKAALQVVLVKPESFDNATEIADHLNAKRTVVLNLESTEKDVARRLVDFLCGVAYANGGKIQRVANSTFIITPYNVDMMGELLDELENTGVFF